jgi:hypothetical protein
VPIAFSNGDSVLRQHEYWCVRRIALNLLASGGKRESMITEKLENILGKAADSLEHELDAGGEDGYTSPLPDADFKQLRRLVTRMWDIVEDSQRERDEELAAAAPAGTTATVAPGAKVPVTPGSELQARAEMLYPLMTKRRGK